MGWNGISANFTRVEFWSLLFQFVLHYVLQFLTLSVYDLKVKRITCNVSFFKHAILHCLQLQWRNFSFLLFVVVFQQIFICINNYCSLKLNIFAISIDFVFEFIPKTNSCFSQQTGYRTRPTKHASRPNQCYNSRWKAKATRIVLIFLSFLFGPVFLPFMSEAMAFPRRFTFKVSTSTKTSCVLMVAG